jgi:predicted Zn-ribbon and HTH transcriptional regulator
MQNDDALSPVTPQRVREIAEVVKREGYWNLHDELHQLAAQLERNAEVLTLSTAPKPNDSPYSPAPDGRCERCDSINCIIREHLDHGEFAHAGRGRYGCVEEILRALESLAPPEEK